MNTRRLLSAATIALCGFATLPAQASDTYPSSPIRLVVPFAPGGSTDLLARAVAKGLSAELDQTIVVENASGAGGLIGTQQVERAKPDGYTLVIGTVSTLGVNPLIQRSNDAQEINLAPISLLAESPAVLLANPAVEANTMDELLTDVRTHPENYSMGSPGAGTIGHLLLASFNTTMKTDILHVPYRGMGPALTAALGGETPLVADQYASAAGQVAAGKLKALGVYARERLPLLPDVPTFEELGYPELNILGLTWFGLLAPEGTPEPIITRLNDAVKATLANEEMASLLNNMGLTPMSSTPEALSERIDTTLEHNRTVIDAAQITLQ